MRFGKDSAANPKSSAFDSFMTHAQAMLCERTDLGISAVTAERADDQTHN